MHPPKSDIPTPHEPGVFRDEEPFGDLRVFRLFDRSGNLVATLHALDSWIDADLADELAAMLSRRAVANQPSHQPRDAETSRGRMRLV